MDRLVRFAEAKNYALFYGTGKEEELTEFDMVIVEPKGQSKTAVRRIQASGTLVLAYLSVMEIPPNTPETKLLNHNDFLQIKGQRLMNEEYGNYLADLRSDRWVRLLLHKAGNLINNMGYDGLFLDTIGDVESNKFASGLRDQLLMAAADIVRQIRRMIPGHILIQNCGLEKLSLLTANLINGICWENPPFGNMASGPWIKATVNLLERLRDKCNLKILLLLEKDDTLIGELGAYNNRNIDVARQVALNKNFLLYIAPIRYIRRVNLPTSLNK